MDDRFVLLSGCSGGGKSSLLGELQARGYNTIEEPGRRIVRQELESGGKALPWLDAEAFARRTVEMARSDGLTAQSLSGWVFFDRGLIDAASALEAVTGEPLSETLHSIRPYHRRVFLTPPWPEIHTVDAERQHDFEAGLAEYFRLEKAFPALGYETIVLPKISVSARADFVLSVLSIPAIAKDQAR